MPLRLIEQLADAAKKRLRLEGLRDELVVAETVIAVARHLDHADVRPSLAQPGDELRTAQPRHDRVGHYEVDRRLAADERKRLRQSGGVAARPPVAPAATAEVAEVRRWEQAVLAALLAEAAPARLRRARINS